MRPNSIRTSVQLHLDQAEIDPELDFFGAVASDDLPGFYLARLVRPALE